MIAPCIHSQGFATNPTQESTCQPWLNRFTQRTNSRLAQGWRHSFRRGFPLEFPLLPVQKKNGKWRWVVDFRLLNSVTRKDTFPIPNIVEPLSYLRKSKFFTSLDLAQAFHSEIDREKLSFCGLDKFYQFCRMPFGLTSAPNTWARLVTYVMQEIPKSQLIVFFDDLLIHSPDLETHMETLKQVFVLIRRAGLHLNMEKTDWVFTEPD